MRPLTFGVLLSVGPEPTPAPRRHRDLEAHKDLRSASDLLAGLRAQGHQAVALPVDEQLDVTLRQWEVDACFLALHGRCGGLGDVQSLLALRKIPFFGPPAGAVSLAFDKIRARQMLAYHNVPVLPAVALGREHHASERALALLGWPCVVKPRRGALGLGVAPLTDVNDVAPLLEHALEVDAEILLERHFVGTEIQVVLLGDRILGAVELGETPEGVQAQICPPRLSRGRMDGIHHLARRAVAALGLQAGLCRVDILTCDRHNEVVLEVEPLPPLDRDGVVARTAKAAGISYEALVHDLAGRVISRAPNPSARPAAVYLQ